MTIFLSALIGIIAFYISIKLCNTNKKYYKIIKYISAAISIAYLTNFFVLLVLPKNTFIVHTIGISLELSMLVIFLWIILHEVTDYFK